MNHMNDDELQKLFEAMEPPQGHTERFRKKLLLQERRKMNRVRWIVSVAALWIVGMISIPFWNAPLPHLQSKDIENSNYYIQQIQLEKTELLDQYGKQQPLAIDRLLQQLEKLKDREERLREELYTYENYEILLPALMENLRTQLEILEDLKNDLRPKNQDSYENSIF